MGHVIRACLLAAALAAAAPARAALGESEASVARDRAALAAVARGSTDRGGYTVHEMVQGGTTIREYVSPEGVVFAVAWAGLANPDLRTLLGGYAPEYEAAAKSARNVNGKRARRVAAEHVVVDRWGHMRDRHGRAWAPDLLPEGVDVDAIR